MKVRNKRQETCKHHLIMGGELMAEGRPPLVQTWCDKCGYGYLGLEDPSFMSAISIEKAKEIVERINNFHNVTIPWRMNSPDIEEYEETETHNS